MARFGTAVVGGGIFGVTAAVHLARLGHSVVLFERSSGLLSAASNGNQRRMHRGYHYPRGIETALSALRSANDFETEYPSAIDNTRAHYVAISKRDSLVSAERYASFCAKLGLRCREEYPSFLRRSSVEVCLRIDESLIDVDVLRRQCEASLAAAGVVVRLREHADREALRNFDHIVLATYASLNHLLVELGCRPREYQFEVCEKPIVTLPSAYQNTSLVIMDGPFMCLDPVAGAQEFLLGNVNHAIWATTVGDFPLIPNEVLAYLDRGVVRTPAGTHFPEFVGSAHEFLVGFNQARHLGSIFTTRAVLPDVEATDDRPTLVERIDERIVTIFGGKITTCVEAARVTARTLSASVAGTTV